MARGADIFTEDPLVTLKKSYFFRRQRPNLLENELNGFSDGNHGVIITRSVATINDCCANVREKISDIRLIKGQAWRSVMIRLEPVAGVMVFSGL